MWQRFTHKARDVVHQAQTEAESCGSDLVSSEHLLLAVLAGPDTIGARMLGSLNVDFAEVEATVRAASPTGMGRTSAEMRLTDDALRSIELAYDESKRLGDNYIGSEHLVIGSIRNESGGAGKALAAAGVDLEAVRAALVELRRAPPRVEPTGILQRFTISARRAVFFAHEEAIHLGAHLVAPEHLLLGLLRDEDTIAGNILNRLGVWEKVRAAVEEAAPVGEAGASEELQMTPRAKRAIDLAHVEARQLRDMYIGTEHLLLGLFSAPESVPSRVLIGVGVTADAVREIIRVSKISPPADDAAHTDRET